ncbi:hypothetical protein C2E23DRAFT_322415 [Lenzites betulinus]|nr:hypothetical protein C2E23DRAFT_322415 [Lenzites betulinus]
MPAAGPPNSGRARKRRLASARPAAGGQALAEVRRCRVRSRLAAGVSTTRASSGIAFVDVRRSDAEGARRRALWAECQCAHSIAMARSSVLTCSGRASRELAQGTKVTVRLRISKFRRPVRRVHHGRTPDRWALCARPSNGRTPRHRRGLRRESVSARGPPRRGTEQARA